MSTATSTAAVTAMVADADKTRSKQDPWTEFCVVCSRLQRMFSFTRVNRMVIPVHRYTGLLYLLQLPASFLLVTFDFRFYLRTPLWCTMTLAGLIQACSASYYFRNILPKKMDPGFMSMGNIGRASWFFICENIFFSGILLFASCYCHPAAWLLAKNRGFALIFLLGCVEALFVFLPYVWRPLFPKTSLRDSHKYRQKNTSQSQLDFYTKNTMVIKMFYNFAKHYIGFFLNYIVFFGRVTPESEHHNILYGIMVLGSYMTTGAMFIHTLVFKGYVPNKAGAMLYQAGYPVTIYLYYRMVSTVIWPNLDLAIMSTVGMFLNFIPNLGYFHTYQAVIMCFCYIWRNVLANHASNHINPENWEAFVQELPAAAARVPPALTAMLALIGVSTVIFAQGLPRLALHLNPFYRAAKQLKKLKPHAEDDPDSES